MKHWRWIGLGVALLMSSCAGAQERIRDVIYAKSGGAAFTMDVFKPKTSNGAAVIYLVSGGWFSSHDSINTAFADALNAEGFTVLEVVHGSQPKYTIPEITKLVGRAIRFAHAQAGTYGYDPNRIGITGASAGGHLSLFCAGKGDAGDPNAKDPVDRQPSTVAAVVAIMPPTDFTNYGTYTAQQLLTGILFSPFKPAFGIPANPTPDQVDKIAKDASPIFTINPAFPPTLLIHGDADPLVPFQQSEIMRDALTKASISNELLPIKGGKHDGNTFMQGMPRLISWFKEKLVKK